jgi:hypothetical protein
MDPDKLLDALSAGETRLLVSALERRGLVSKVVAATEAEVLAALSPETRARADDVRAQLAALLTLGVDDLAIVPIPISEFAAAAAVVLATVNGLKRGSWDEIFASPGPDEFGVELDGGVYDARSGMTWPVYRALVERAKTLSLHPLPDSHAGTENDEQPWTCTLLTGEAMDGGRVPFAFVNDDEAGRSWGGRDYRGGLRFRPAVIVEPRP